MGKSNWKDTRELLSFLEEKGEIRLISGCTLNLQGKDQEASAGLKAVRL